MKKYFALAIIVTAILSIIAGIVYLAIHIFIEYGFTNGLLFTGIALFVLAFLWAIHTMIEE